MWLGDELARDLQWARADRSGRPFARVPGFPSWSWASQGRIKADQEGTDVSKIEAAGVRWHTPWSHFLDTLFTVKKVSCVSGAAEQTGGHARLEETGPLVISLPLPGDYGIENRFLALRIKGDLAQNFYIKQEWPGRQCELDRTAKLTATWFVNPERLGIAPKYDKRRDEVYTDKAWCQIIRGNIRLGWVSFDDTNLLVDNTDSGPCIAGDRRRAIFALRLSKISGIRVDIPGYEVVTVYAVLFVAKCEARIGDECCFERVGVGRMISDRTFPSIGDSFRGKSSSTFWLI